MQLRDDSYRAIELLRFLRRATAESPWTVSELAIAIAIEDESITRRLAPLYHLDEGKEDNVKIQNCIRQILQDRKKNGYPIPAIEAVKSTLNKLVNNMWVVAKRGKGYWLSEEGRRVPLLDVLHAFGEDAGTARCCRERDPFHCPYRRSCRAYKFHKQLSGQLRMLLQTITVEDIALGVWSKKGVRLSEVRANRGK